jgi:hypothetical protein
MKLQGQRHQPLHQPPTHARGLVGVVDVAGDVEGQLRPPQHARGLGGRVVGEEGEQRQVGSGEGGEHGLGQVVQGAGGQGLQQGVPQARDLDRVNEWMDGWMRGCDACEDGLWCVVMLVQCHVQ